MKKRMLIGLTALIALTAGPVHAVTFEGRVAMLEVWTSGNVAFTLASVTPGYCNNQFIVNVSFPGAKNLIATLLAAKSQERRIRVMSSVDSAGCTAADSHGGSYIKPDYLYVLD
jgi:hypothetical protein